VAQFEQAGGHDEQTKPNEQDAAIDTGDELQGGHVHHLAGQAGEMNGAVGVGHHQAQAQRSADHANQQQHQPAFDVHAGNQPLEEVHH